MKRIAVTIDDAPLGDSHYFTGQARTQKLIETFDTLGLEVLFFVCTQNLDAQGQARIEAYQEAGHVLGHHSHAHPDFNTVNFDEFRADFEKAEQFLERFQNFIPYFRFPYLHEGNEIENRDAMRMYLKNRGYQNGYVTVNTSDWYLNSLFQEMCTSCPELARNAFGPLFVDILKNSAEHYDALAQTLWGRSPLHTLLLHENDVTALFIEDLVHAMRAEGWTFISATEAYTDSLAALETPLVHARNPGRIGEQALERGWSAAHTWPPQFNTDDIDQYCAQQLELATHPFK